MPEDIEYLEDEDDNSDTEELEKTSVYEQFGLLKYLHRDEDLRGVLLSAIYFTKNGYRADIDEVYKKYEFENNETFSGIGFKGDHSFVELVFVKADESWFDLGCKYYIRSVG